MHLTCLDLLLLNLSQPWDTSTIVSLFSWLPAANFFSLAHAGLLCAYAILWSAKHLGREYNPNWSVSVFGLLISKGSSYPNLPELSFVFYNVKPIRIQSLPPKPAHLGYPLRLSVGGGGGFCFILFCFCFDHAACWILVPWPGVEPGPLAVKAQNPNHCITKKFLALSFFLSSKHPDFFPVPCLFFSPGTQKFLLRICSLATNK